MLQKGTVKAIVYRNVYPSDHEEFVETLSDIYGKLDDLFPALLNKAIVQRPQTGVRLHRTQPTGREKAPGSAGFLEQWQAEPTSLEAYRDTTAGFPLDNGLLIVGQAKSEHTNYSVQACRPTRIAPTESLLQDLGEEAFSPRILNMSRFLLGQIPQHSMFLRTPAVGLTRIKDVPDGYYYAADYKGTSGLLENTGEPPVIQPEALSPRGQGIYKEYGPFGVVKYELDQDIAFLQSIIQSYQ